jgi:hypothetical protein
VAETLVFTVDAPPSLTAAVERVRASATPRLEQELARAGLLVPSPVRVTLIDEDDPRARSTPRSVAGRAFGTSDIEIFPTRVTSYPYDSLESVVRHETVHLALNLTAELRPLPRWFHEGVAVSVENGWRLDDRVRLRLAMIGTRQIGIDALDRMFDSSSSEEVTRAYLLAGALASDLREEDGASLPGRIAARVAEGLPFPRAFENIAGESPDAAAARAWSRYTRWVEWIPIATSSLVLWLGILGVAAGAFVARRRRRARIRRQWELEDEEDRNRLSSPPDTPHVS